MKLNYTNRTGLALVFFFSLFIFSDQSLAASVYSTSGTLIIGDPNVSSVFEIATAGTYQADFNYSFVLPDGGWADVAGISVSDGASDLFGSVLGIGSFVFDAQPGLHTLDVFLDPNQLFYGIDYSASISAVPLPAPLLLFAASLLSLLGFRKVRRT